MNPIITAADLPYRANSVVNPAAVRLAGETLLLLRVEDMRGVSHLTLARSHDGLTNWRIDAQPLLAPDPQRYPEDLWGLEDPRITFLPELDTHAVVFISYSPVGPQVSLALTKDFVTFERLGVAMPPSDKDAALFPRRFDGKWLLIHRPYTLDTPAHIKVASSHKLRDWREDRVLLPAREGSWWDARRIGLGPPPLETAAGWLLMYHGVRQTGGGVLYRSSLALLDRDDPTRVLRRSDEWLLGPQEGYETRGDVPNVVFPSGWVLDEPTGQLTVYYGAADSVIGAATADLAEILAYLESCPAVGAPSARDTQQLSLFWS